MKVIYFLSISWIIMLNGTCCEKLDSSLHLFLPALIYSSLSSTLQFSKRKSENWEINERYERKEDDPTLAKRLVLKKSWQIGSKRAEHKPVAGGGDVFSEGQVSAAQETQQMVRRPLEKLTMGCPSMVTCPSAQLDGRCHWRGRRLSDTQQLL